MVASMSFEAISVICGLIVPRLILRSFGSSYNGITASITQFLSCVVLLRAGVAGVTRAALYKPLAEHDDRTVSEIVNATMRFMRRIALIFAASIAGFACLYPLLVRAEFGWVFSATLVLILGVHTFMQYYFGLAYQFLLEADQRQYVLSVIQIGAILLNTVLSAVLIGLGAGIHVVKLGSAAAFSMTPLLLNLYIRKEYRIDRRVPPSNRTLKQRWDAVGQSVAFFIHNNTDLVVLTVFTNMREVSVYTVYNYVIANIRLVLMTFVTGFGAAFGNMLARGEKALLEENLKLYELIVFGLTTVIYATAGTMIVPFVLIYTTGIHDVSYLRPLFAFLVTTAGAFSCYRIPYQSIVEAAGHFRQTRNGAFVEAGLNIGISILAVSRYGLVGVAFGTLVATIFRSVQYSWYLSRHVVVRSPWIFWRHILISLGVGGVTFALAQGAYTFAAPNFLLWGLKAALVMLTALALVMMMYALFFRHDLHILIRKLRAMFRHGIRRRTAPGVTDAAGAVIAAGTEPPADAGQGSEPEPREIPGASDIQDDL